MVWTTVWMVQKVILAISCEARSSCEKVQDGVLLVLQGSCFLLDPTAFLIFITFEPRGGSPRLASGRSVSCYVSTNFRKGVALGRM